MKKFKKKIFLQLKVVILPLDAGGELTKMVTEHQDQLSSTKESDQVNNFGIGFMTLAEVGCAHGSNISLRISSPTQLYQ